MTQPLNLIIPLGGIGSRFQKEGYTQPKPFVKVLGKGMVKWLVEHLSGSKPEDTLVIIYNPKFLTMEQRMIDLQLQLKKSFSSVKLVRLPGPTRGAAETVLYGVKELTPKEKENPCMLLDGDCFFKVDVVSLYRKIAGGCGASVVFRDTQPKPIYSYVKVTDEKNWDVTEIIEKVKISDYANTGCYCFRNGVEMQKYIQLIIDKGEQQLSQDMKGEFYTSGVIKAMLRDSVPFKAIMVDRKDFFVLGTPKHVTDFCNKWVKSGHVQPRRFCFDLDHTLVTGPQVPAVYESCEPVKDRIAFCNWLYDQGHYIIIATARRMRTHNANVGRVVKDIGKLTLEQLNKFGIRYHEIHFGKPWGHFYIDTKSINCLDDLPKELGYYPAVSDKKSKAQPVIISKAPKEGAEAISGPPMNLIIPLGGIGSRFQKQGYMKPKPFVQVMGKPMLYWLMDTLKKNGASPKDSILLIYNPKFLTMTQHMEELVDVYQHSFTSVRLVHLPGPTRGAAETVLFGVKALTNDEKKNPCMLLDGDCFYTSDIVTKYRSIASNCGASIVFHDTQPKPIFSYVKVNNTKSMDVTEIIEKVKISDYANTGCYCFRNGAELQKYIQIIIDKGEKQLSQDMKGEFYTSGVIKAMLRDNIPFKAILVDRKSFSVLGTPAQVKDFVATEAKEGSYTRYRFVFDFDTLFPEGRLSLRIANYLRGRNSEGHYIIIQSCHGMEDGNVFKANKDFALYILNLLQNSKIPYHELSFRKPVADFYIDDKGVCALEDLQKYTGYYDQPKTSPVQPKELSPSDQDGVSPYLVSTAASIAAIGAIFFFKNIRNLF